MCFYYFGSREKGEGREGTKSTERAKGQERAKAKEREGRRYEAIEIEFLEEIRKLEKCSMKNFVKTENFDFYEFSFVMDLQKKGSDSESFDDDDDFEESFKASPPKREVAGRRAASKVRIVFIHFKIIGYIEIKSKYHFFLYSISVESELCRFK